MNMACVQVQATVPVMYDTLNSRIQILSLCPVTRASNSPCI